MKISTKLRQASECIHTSMGTAIYPGEFSMDDVNLEDIAYSLGGINRYNGHTRISVLRHSIAVGLHFPDGTPERLWGFLHDAAEIYMMDVPRPLHRVRGDDWELMHMQAEVVIWGKYGSGSVVPDWKAVKSVDALVPEYEMDQGIRRFNTRMVWPGERKLKPVDIARLDELYMWHMSDDELGAWFIRQVQTLSASLRGESPPPTTYQARPQFQALATAAQTALAQDTPHANRLNGRL